MANGARLFICDQGHDFGVTNWGTPPLTCPLCGASYRPAGRKKAS